MLYRRTFPRPKACACGLTRKTLRALRYSVEPVVERGVPRGGSAGGRARHFMKALRVVDKSCEVRLRTRKGFARWPCGKTFDAVCLQQTLPAGAELKKIESVVAVRELAAWVEIEVAAGGWSQLRRCGLRF